MIFQPVGLRWVVPDIFFFPIYCGSLHLELRLQHIELLFTQKLQHTGVKRDGRSGAAANHRRIANFRKPYMDVGRKVTVS